MSRLARRAATALAAAALATTAALGASAPVQAQPPPAPPAQGTPTPCLAGAPIFAQPGTPPPAGVCRGHVTAECFVATPMGLWVRVTGQATGVKGYTFATVLPDFDDLGLAPCPQAGPAPVPQSVG